MRTNDPDPLTNSEPWRPLGEKVERAKPAPEEKAVDPKGHIIQGSDGKLHTNIPLPPCAY